MSRKTAILIGLILGVIILGTTLYRFLEGWSWFDSFYMTMLTLTTTGYGELYAMTYKGRLVSIFLMVVGVSIFLYVISTLTSGLLRDMWSKGLVAMIARLRDHTIICGYGKLGKELASALDKTKLVIVDESPLEVERAKEKGYYAVMGDATQEEVLDRAGIKRARALIASLDSDAKNFVLSMVAKNLNPKLLVIATAKGVRPDSSFWKNSKADVLISPYIETVYKVKHLLSKPLTVRLIDVLTSEGGSIQLESIEVRSREIVNRTIAQLDIRKRFGVNLILIERRGKFILPEPETELRLGDKVFALGEHSKLEKFERYVSS